MKKILLPITVILFCLFANAQTTLQFSKVNLLTATATYGNYVTVGTVPAGKVWKLENAGAAYGTTVIPTSNILLRLNGTTITPFPSNWPFWFPAGTLIEAYSADYDFTLVLSVVEFTVE